MSGQFNTMQSLIRESQINAVIYKMLLNADLVTQKV